MVVGESGLGKTTLVNTLFATELAQAKNYRQRFSRQLDRTTEVDVIKAEVRSSPPPPRSLLTMAADSRHPLAARGEGVQGQADGD
jgi:septin family protein